MVIKDKFILLKDIPNILHMPSKEIKEFSIDRGPRKVFVVLDLYKDRINHYSKEQVFSLITDLEKRKKIAVVNLPDYNFHISYNKPTKQIVLNISPFDIDDIYSTEPGEKDLYAQVVYALCFYKLVTEQVKIKDHYAYPIANFIFSMMVSMFGKEYGLLGGYSSNIPKLNFLVNCYVLSSFFGIVGNKSYKLSSAISSFNFKEIESELNTYDFSNIEIFIKSLSDFKVFPGMNKYSFLSKILKTTGKNFIPAIEDCSRFISIMTCINIKGSNIIPTYLSKYNTNSFEKIIQISKLVFK